MFEKQNLKYILPFFIAAVLIVFINTQILLISYIPSPSMEPTLNIGDTVISTRFINEISREDIVVFEQDDTLMIKRVIGLPGETIEIKKNKIYVDGEYLKCPYIAEQMDTDDMKLQIPDNSFFVMGDNRNNSMDSRVFGTISKEQIKGKKL